MAGGYYVKYRGVGIDFEQTPEKTVGRRKDYSGGITPDTPDEKKRDRAAQEREYLKSKTKARHNSYESVGQPSAYENRDKRDKMMIEHRMGSRSPGVNSETLRENLRRPGQICIIYADNRDKSGCSQQRGGICEVSLERCA